MAQSALPSTDIITFACAMSHRCLHWIWRVHGRLDSRELWLRGQHGLLKAVTAGGGCRSFYDQLELLLDETVLVGKGRTCIAELRPLAFSMLAELIHHVRQDLKLPQLVRIIYLFSRYVPQQPCPCLMAAAAMFQHVRGPGRARVCV